MQLNWDQILSVKGLHVLLSGSVAALSATLIQKRVIPEPLQLETESALFTVVAILLTFTFWSKLRKLLPYFALASLATLSLLTFIQVHYVVTANVGGEDKDGETEHRFLIGYRLTEEGKRDREDTHGPNQSEKYYIESAGYDLIPEWYGSSFKVMKAAYTVSYMLFVICVVLTIGGILSRTGEMLVPSTATGVPPHHQSPTWESGIQVGTVASNVRSNSPTKSEHEQIKTIKILFLAANPEDKTLLRLHEEAKEIDLALRNSEFRDRFDLEQHGAVRARELSGLLLRHKPDIVHFSGHGSEDNEIILEDDSGNSDPVPTAALSELFELLKDNIRCVVLNACYSEPQAQAIANHIDCVIGMSDAIEDDASISFAASFYEALGYGRNVETAFKLGRNRINLENLAQQDIPKLLANRVDPKTVVLIS